MSSALLAASLLATSARAAEPGLPSDLVGTLEPACGPLEPTLTRAASALASRSGPHPIAAAEVVEALRDARAAYVWPHAFTRRVKRGERRGARERVLAWLSSLRKEGGERRCGVGTRLLPGGEEQVVVIALDTLAELNELPKRVRVAAWVDVDAELLVPVESAQVVVLGPRGRPRTLLSRLSGTRVSARFNADAPGTWLVQVLADVGEGPRPVLESRVSAGLEPSNAPPALQPLIPGERAAHGRAPRAALEALIEAARRSERLASLERSPELEALAQAHATHMLREQRVVHDAGAGDPSTRLELAGLSVARLGENVAHAPNAILAQRALWSSPSHRANLLNPHFDSVGIGVATDVDGSLWVCELFARKEGQ